MIELRTLGLLALTDADGREIRSLLTQPRRLALLLYLAVATPRGLHPRDRILALFWPELDQARARAALRQALHVLRSALGADAIVARGDEDIGVDPAIVRCDAASFDDAVAARRHTDAVDLYRGHLLEAFFITDAPEFEHWLDGERARLRLAATRSARALIDEADAAGDPARAAYWAGRAVGLTPLDENLVQRLITLLGRLGDRAGAVAAYEDYARRLAHEVELEPSAETQALIQAVRATAIPMEPASGITGTRTPEPAPPARVPAQPARRRWLRPALGASGLVALLVSAVLIARRPHGRVGSSRTIGVMPLRSSGDSNQVRYADDLTEALTTDLGRLRGLRVVSRSALTQRGGEDRPLRDVARALHLDAVIEGGVQQSGDSLRVDVALVDPTTGVELWTDHIREPVRNWFAVEDTVARRVAAALSLPLSAGDVRALGRQPTTDERAYERYLQARIEMRTESRKTDSLAITLLEQAVAQDPSFAAAWAQLARAYALRLAQFAREDTLSRTKAYLAVDRALRLDPDLAEAHWANGALLWGITRTFPHERAIREDRRALALNPNLADAHHNLGQIYLHVGLLDSAIAEFRAALALNPFDENAQRRIGVSLLYLGRPEEALAALLQAAPQSNEPLWTYFVATARMTLGRDAEAAAQLEQYLHAHPEDPGGVAHSTRAILRARAGDHRGAEDDIRLAVAAGKDFTHFHHAAYNIGVTYALLGQGDRALYWLRYAARNGFPCYPCVRDDPNLTRLHGDQGFEQLLRDLQREWRRYRAMS